MTAATSTHSPIIALIDYQKGNINSVVGALKEAGAEVVVATSPQDLQNTEGLVIPGVGSFADAMATLHETGLTEAISQDVEQGKPFLGICLGLQLLFNWGQEGAEKYQENSSLGASADTEGNPIVSGLGLLPGTCTKMELLDSAGLPVIMPHVGWNQVVYSDNVRLCPLFEGIDDNSNFYYTHSFHVSPENPDLIAGYTSYAQTFVSAAWQDHIFGVQFHPETSSTKGRQLISNFVNYVRNVEYAGL